MEVGKRVYLAGAAFVGLVVLGGVGGWLKAQQGGSSPDVTASPPGVVAARAASTTDSGPMEFPAGGPPSPEPSATPGGPAVTPPSSPTPAPTPTPSAELVVHVSGAVKKPGVYHFKPGDRIYQAVDAAGGFQPNANQDAINLADTLRDADQISVPVKASPTPKAPLVAAHPAPPKPVIVAGTPPRTAAASPRSPEPPRGRVLGKEPTLVASLPDAPVVDGGDAARAPKAAKPGGTGSEKLRTPGEGYVNINTAGADELQRLPGVGPAMSQRILDYRQTIGRFANPQQLRDVKGIGEKTFAKMQPFVRVD